MTVKETIAYCRSYGMRCTYEDGEYRVNFYGGREATAYYTSSAADAKQTALAMKKRKYGLFGA